MTELQPVRDNLQQHLEQLQARRAETTSEAPPELSTQIEELKRALTLIDQAIAGQLAEPTRQAELRSLLDKIGQRSGQGGVNISGLSGSSLSIGGSVMADVKAGRDVAGRDIINIHSPPAPKRDKNLTVLLDNVCKIWVEDFLDSALLKAIYIDLGLQEKQTAVPQPFEELNISLRRSEQAEQDLPAGTRAIEVYRQAGNSLLILGQPGSGKTTTLATLAGDLVTEAEENPTAPVPVIFNLSSWAAGQKPLGDWLVDELNRNYQVSRKLAERWLEDDQLALLLDGLDEVAEAQRGACVAAINTYRKQDYSGPVVVCSRLADYEALETLLEVRQAIVLKALTRPQVEGYFEKLAAQQDRAQVRGSLRGLGEQIWQDEALRELVETPLMLNIIVATYAHPEAPPLPREAGDSLRAQIFEAYTERMFSRRGRAVKLLHPKEEMGRYLEYLAAQLQAHSLTQFSIGQIWSSWLPVGPIRRQYRWLSGLIFGLFFGLVIGLPGGLIFGLLFGLLFGVIFGLSRAAPAERLMWVWGPAIKAIGGGILGGLLGGATIGWLAAGGITLPVWLSWGLRVGLIVGMGVWLSHGLLIGLISGLLGGVFGGLIGKLSGERIAGLIFGLRDGMIGELIDGLIVGSPGTELEFAL